MMNHARPLVIHPLDPSQAPPPFDPGSARPTAYAPHLTPILSPLRLHCLARDRLRLWKPAPQASSLQDSWASGLSEQDLLHIFDVTSNTWAESTYEAYSSDILAYHVHCDHRSIPEHLWAPASHSLVASFVSSLAGSYSGSTISNYVHGLHVWHVLHGMPWKLNSMELEALMKGSDCLAPDSSRRKKHLPYTPKFMTAIRSKLHVGLPFDAAVWACLTTCFYAAAHVGEFTVPWLSSFNPSLHVTTSNLQVERNQNNLEVTVLHIPHTKAAPVEGEDVYWSRQPRDPLQGHVIRIGATLHYLSQGIPLEAMKIMDRWGSDAFLPYLRKHAQILTPYIQAMPELHEAFLKFILPAQQLLQGRHWPKPILCSQSKPTAVYLVFSSGWLTLSSRR